MIDLTGTQHIAIFRRPPLFLAVFNIFKHAPKRRIHHILTTAFRTSRLGLGVR